MKHTLEQFQALRRQFDISVDRAAIAIGTSCGRKILSGKLERFERGQSEPRSAVEANAIIKFYQTLERGVKPPHIPDPVKPHGKPSKKLRGPYKTKAKAKRQALEDLLVEGKKTSVKCNGDYLSTSLAGEGISFFPEGQYLLQVDSKGVKVYSLERDSNPMAATVASMQAELEKYRKGWENWTALRDLVKD